MKSPVRLLAAIFATLLTVTVIVPVASAQQSIRVTVPFAFTASHQVLPAGSYRIERPMEASEPYLILLNRTTGKVAGILMVLTSDSYRTLARSSLVFYNTGHKYWLTEVRFAGSNIASQLSSRPEPEPGMAKASVNTTVEIAAE